MKPGFVTKKPGFPLSTHPAHKLNVTEGLGTGVGVVGVQVKVAVGVGVGVNVRVLVRVIVTDGVMV